MRSLILAVALTCCFAYAMWLGHPEASVFEWTVITAITAVAVSSSVALSRGMRGLRIANTVVLFALVLASPAALVVRGRSC